MLQQQPHQTKSFVPEFEDNIRDPWEMTSQEFCDELMNQQPNGSMMETFIDWGGARQQGKRSGNTIMGGMSNAPKGVKRYVGFRPAYPEWKDLKGTSANPVLYALGREFGLSHRHAGVLAIKGETSYHEWAVNFALNRNLYVSPDALAEYL